MRTRIQGSLLTLGAAVALASAARADFNPIPLTPESFTHDVIVEKTAPPPLNTLVTATMDGGTNNNSWTWFEQGYLPANPTVGLPQQGATFMAPNDSTMTFKLAPNYSANNALLVYTNGSPTGTLSLVTPATYSVISIVAAASGGEVGALQYTISYQGGGSETGTMIVRDWFNTTATEVAWNANGRISMDDGNKGNLYGTTPKLFYSLIYPTGGGAITQISFSSTSVNRAVIFAVSGFSGAGYDPIELTGFNRDMIIEKTAPFTYNAQDRVNVTMDGGSPSVTGNTWYEVGYNKAAPTTGLPVAGSTLTAGNVSFAMPASYVGSNALYIANFRNYTAGTLTLNSPAAYSGLSFLTASGNGPLVMNVTVHHDDTSTEAFTISSPDWFNQAGAVYTTAGRVDAGNLALNNVNDVNPRLYATNITLTGTSPVTSIDFAYVSGGRGPIFAVSGQTTSGGNFTPVAVSGFNADIVVEAIPAYPPFGLQTYTTATMDGGVNNTGATWNERGYYPLFPDAGLPPAGTIITSVNKSDHHYQLPATYTGNNAAFVDSVRSNVSLTLATPMPYSALSFLSATANNNVTNQVIIQFQDGTSETNTFVSRDWFNNTPFVYNASGRVNVPGRAMNNAGTSNPRLYEAEFALANNVSPVTNVVLKFLGAVNPTTGRMVVLAVSATAGAVRPIISTMPASFRALEGSNVVLAAAIGGGTPPIAYQWYAGTNGIFAPVSNGGPVSGATTPSLNLNPIGWTNTADYYLVASNVAGSSTSAVTTVTVMSGLPDVTRPSDPIAVYQPNGGNPPPGAEGAEHSIDNLTSKYLNFGDGLTPFTGPAGFIVSPPRPGTIVNVLRFYTANDAAERDPSNYLLEGSKDGGISFTTISSGALALPGDRNAAALALNPLTQFLQEVRFNNTVGYTSYRLSFSAVKGGVNLLQIGEVELLGLPDPASLPTIVAVPVNVTANEGSTAKFTVTATGPGTLGYQWYNVTAGDPGTPVAGQTSATLTLPNVTTTMNGNLYRVVVNNQYGSVTTPATVNPAAQLTVQSGVPVVTTDLALEEVVYAGRTAVLPVAISGTEPFTLQWQKNGGNLIDTARITGSQSNVLTIVNSQSADTGNYQLATIQSALGTAQSSVQALTVQTVPALTPNGAGWALNGTPTPAPVIAGVLELTANQGNTARSAWYKAPLFIGAFKATFLYQDVNGGGADGIAFALQRDLRGTTALGGGGGGLGFSGLVPSAALQFNIYGTAGIAFNTNGNTGNYSPSGSVTVNGTDPIRTDISYTDGVMQVTLSNTVSTATFTTNYAVGSLSALLGAETAYVGFTGADGGTPSLQTVSDFKFIPMPTLTAQTVSSTVVLSWPASIGGFKVQSATSLTSPVWVDAGLTESLVGNQFQATVTAPLGTVFYRLVITP